MRDGQVSEETTSDSATPEPVAFRSLRVALVTETYPPEINGVATTVAHLVDGISRRGHVVELTRPVRKESMPPGCLSCRGRGIPGDPPSG